MKSIKELNEEEMKQAVHNYILDKTGETTSSISFFKIEIKLHPMAQSHMLEQIYTFKASAEIDSDE